MTIQSSNLNFRAKTICQGHEIQIYRSDKITKFQEIRSAVACKKIVTYLEEVYGKPKYVFNIPSIQIKNFKSFNAFSKYVTILTASW